MNSKIFFIALAVCFSQVIAKKASRNGPPSGGTGPEAFPNEIMEAFDKMYAFGKHITFSVMEPFFRNNNPKAATCYNKQQPAYTTLAKSFASKMKEAANDFEKDFKGSNNRKLSKQFQKSMTNTAKIMSSYPSKLTDMVKKDKLEKAADYMQDSREKFRKNDAQFLKTLQDVRKESPDAAGKTEKRVREIRNDAQKESVAMAKEFEKCVKS